MQFAGIKKTGWLLILVGSVVWSLTMVKSGFLYPFGMGFWGPNGHDGVWHIALITSLARGSLEVPVFAGETVKNYHIGFDLLLAALHKATSIPAYTLYFQVIPPIVALLIGILTYRLVFLWKASHSASFWATFFVYFGGNFGWIVTFFRSGDVGGESMFWSQQAISTLLNPPFATSLILILAGLYFLLKYQKTVRMVDGLYATLAFGLLVQIKVYGGILALAGLLVCGLVMFLTKRDFAILRVFLGAALIAWILFLPLNRSASGLLVFQPLWFLETMMAISDRVGWPKFYEAMTTYRMGGIWAKAFLAYTVALFIFLLGNIGTRVVAIWVVPRNKHLDTVTTFFLTVALLGVLLPMIFLQKGTPWNTIQFFYYTLFALGIFAGVAFSKVASGRRSKILIGVLLILTLPTTFATLRHYLPARPPAKISGAELAALHFLGKQEKGVVLTFPYNAQKALEAVANPPRPLYLYESTAYVAAFSGQPVYLEDEVNLNIMGYNWPERRQKVLDFLETLDEKIARDFLRTNRIKYVYWIGNQRGRLGEGQFDMTQIFENKEVKIYSVN